MNNTTYSNGPSTLEQDYHLPRVVILLLVGIALAAVLAQAIASKPKRYSPGLQGQLERRLDESRDTAHRLEREVQELRRKVEDRLQEIR